MTSITTHSDEELLDRMLSGDEEAFVTLYRRRQSGIYRFALHMSGSESVAEDVTQEVFMVLLQQGGRYDQSRGPLAAYLYGIARNQVLRYVRREQGSSQLTDEINGSGSVDGCAPVSRDDPLAELTRNQTVESVRLAVLSLPAHYREVVVLCELHEMSYADAAVALDCAIGTVRSRLHRARGLLMERLGENERRTAGTVASEKENRTRCFA